MRRLGFLAILISLALAIPAESIRGPVVDTLNIGPADEALDAEFAVEEIVLASTTGDSRFFDAIEIEITVPAAVADLPGAFSLVLMSTGTITERADVAEINGEPLLTQPLVRGGKLTFQIPLHPNAETNASAAVTVLDRLLTQEDLPLAVTVLASMKGLPTELAEAQIAVSVRPVPRRIGSVEVEYLAEDGSLFQMESYAAVEFQMEVDGARVETQSEYLLSPGLHYFHLISEKYQDQTVTIGVEQARAAQLSIPLVLALATVNYTAPRGSRVYVDGTALDAAMGDFTAPPGEHTIVVVVGDYTVTRRFSVEEGREYSLSVTMDVAIEEAK